MKNGILCRRRSCFIQCLLITVSSSLLVCFLCIKYIYINVPDNLPVLVSITKVNMAPTIDNNNNTHKPDNRYPEKESQVIIASYMRSGSSITGRVLEEDPDTFYIFEPLQAAKVMRDNYMSAVYLDQPIRIMRREDNSLQDIIKSTLNCELNKINLASLSQFHMDKSSSTGDFYYCTHTTPFGQWKDKCFAPFLDLCLSKKHSVIKTIRMRIDSLRVFLDENPKIKLIHLIRDPRAITVSKYTSWATKSPTESEIQKHINKSATLCRTMLDDLKASETIFRTHPDRVRILVYERFAYSPVDIVRQLYKFVGFNFSKRIERFVHDVTSSGKEENCSMCISKSNSYLTSLKWRKVLTFEQVQKFDRHCLDVFEKAGYTRFRNKGDLLNFSIVTWQYQGQPGYFV